MPWATGTNFDGMLAHPACLRNRRLPYIKNDAPEMLNRALSDSQLLFPATNQSVKLRACCMCITSLSCLNKLQLSHEIESCLLTKKDQRQRAFIADPRSRPSAITALPRSTA